MVIARTWVLSLSGALLALGLHGAHAQAPAPRSEPVGLVTEFAGAGSVAQKPDGGALEQLHELMPGAVVTLTAGARAVVVHTPSGVVYELAGPGRYRVLPASLEALSGRLSKRDLPPEIKSFQLKPLSTMQASIVLRGSAPARLEGPSGGVLGADELSFRIRGEVRSASIDLIDADGRSVLSTPEAPAVFNPAQATALRPGQQYVVRVKGNDARGKPVELSSRFWLVDPDVATRLRAARPGETASLTDLIVYAMALEVGGATATAREVWRVVNERR